MKTINNIIMKAKGFLVLLFVLFGFMASSQAVRELHQGEYFIWQNTAIDDGTVAAADTSAYVTMYGVHLWSLQAIATQGDGSSGTFALQVSNDFVNWEDYSATSTDTFDGTDTTFYFEDDWFAWRYLRIKCDTIDATITVRMYLQRWLY